MDRRFPTIFVLSILLAGSLALAQTPRLQEPGCRPCEDPLHGSPETGDVCAADLPPTCGGGGSSAGSVYLHSGEFHHEEVDLRIAGRGLDFVWARSYRSRLGKNVRMGVNWDFSYDIRIEANDVGPSEVLDLLFDSPDLMHWQPPANPGGNPADLRYCTLRAIAPQDFVGGTVFAEVDSIDQMTVDPVVPAPGDVHFYLVSAKNLNREGPHGVDSNGVARNAMPCGLPGQDIVVHDGDSRSDTYFPTGPTSWEAPEMFRTLTRNPNGTYTLTFPDTGEWRFLALDNSPAEGRVSRIVDRNGNALTFSYDGFGRLDQIVDTLGRPIQVAYNADGFIQSVTDFTGRSVTYTYYDGTTPEGSFGDLESATSPTVLGTPNGNDYPAGKTTVYTYAKGFADPALNHNLLTITDAKGQTWLENTYAATLNPADVEYDHVVRQQLGFGAEWLDYFYLPVPPNPGNNFAVLRTIENDRRGIVTESFFDVDARLVMLHEYTGLANPNLQTTDVVNRPGLPLRPADPPLFETRWSHDADARVIQTIHPNQNDELLFYDSVNPDRRSQGNLLEQCRNPGPLGGLQPVLCQQWLYDDFAGGGNGTNMMTEHTDPRGNTTVHTYDPTGNRLQTRHRIPSIVEDFVYNGFGQLIQHDLPDNGAGVRRRDTYTYYGPGPQEGYLESVTVDDGGFNLVTVYEYDSLGRRIREITPAGHDTLWTYNELDQVVHEVSPEPQPASTRYETLFWYDPNDNLVRRDVLNVDDAGAVAPNAWLTTVWQYEILDHPIRECREYDFPGIVLPGTPNQPVCPAPAAGNGFATEDFFYDGNRNRVFVASPETTNGNQPGNVTEFEYDERDLLLREVRAPGALEQSTTEFHYDGNRNTTQTFQGLESGSPRIDTFVYDGYDRLVTAIDPMENVTVDDHDENGNVVHRTIEGELFDVPGAAGNVRLHEVTYDYDTMDRRTRETVEFFDANTQAALPGGTVFGQRLHTNIWSDNSQIIETIDDNGFSTKFVYDSANRLELVTDAKDNALLYLYDANSNIITIEETEKSDLGAPDENFVTTYVYDGLDRRTVTTDSAGNLTEVGYDSRGNLVRRVDGLGNEVRFTYDGLDRLLTEDRTLTDTGDGTGLVIGSIVTQKAWDDNSRQILDVDGNGNRTTYEYDVVDRRILVGHDDGTVHQSEYDPHHNVVFHTDANGSQLQFQYDLNDRRTQMTVVGFGAGVVPTTTFEQFQYDGVDRLRTATDDDSFVERSYDSLGNVTTDEQNGVPVTVEYDGLGRSLQAIYPGGRTIQTSRDALGRIRTVSDGAGIADYQYVGPGRVERREYANGTQTVWSYDGISGVANPPGDDGVKRVIEMQHSDLAGVVVIDARSFRWDPVYDKRSSQDTSGFGPQLTIENRYDSVYRLRREVRTDGGGVTVGDVAYEYDDVGNRVNVLGGPLPGAYVMNAVDAPVNQYTQTSFDQRLYDANGNLIDTDGVGPILFEYDVRNQFVQGQVSPVGFVFYRYDALGRRIETTDASGTTTRYFYDGWRVVEETDPGLVTQATYVWGNAPDELLQMERGAPFFAHEDDLGSLRAMTDAAGNVVERYEYTDFGEPRFFDAFWNPVGASLIDNPYGFTGRRFDADTRWNYYRTRYMDPRAGRFTTRDTIGVWGDPAEMGNGFSYVGNNPATYVDPMGRIRCVPKLVRDRTGNERIYWGSTWRKYLWSWGAASASDSGFSMTVSGSAGAYYGLFYTSDSDVIEPSACVDCECVEPGKCRITVSSKSGSVWKRDKGVVSLAAQANVTYRGDDEVDVEFTAGAGNYAGDAVGAGVGPYSAGISFPSSGMAATVSLGSAKWRCEKR